ncbi:hypothetical protein OF83DRAFT_1049061 [Amylostereum chailletii]|nr:hypothetical protein OF83DRAFT_1049061 [Amylostereum chailletii]
MNPNTTLCLACSSSLPPRLFKLAQPSLTLSPNPKQAYDEDSTLFFTKCCSRPICPSCLSSNPRLARYDPCLACLGGARAVGSSSGIESSAKHPEPRNVDGAVRDEDVFAVGSEDEDEEEDEETGRHPDIRGPATPPPAYEAESKMASEPDQENESRLPVPTFEQPAPSSPEPAPRKYHIRPGDTLQGISLRYGVDGRALCRLNAIPPSTLSTTPHLLHTRSFITLPPSAKVPPGDDSVPALRMEEEKERAHAREVERAQKRFQFVTKEVDWRVAQAYVALAESEPGRSDKYEGEKKEFSPFPNGSSEGLDSRAVDRYLDDDEWEEQERRAGRGVRIERFPLGPGEVIGKGKASAEGKGWSRR